MFRKFVGTFFSTAAVVPSAVFGLTQSAFDTLPGPRMAAMVCGQPQPRVDHLVEYTEYFLAMVALFLAYPMYLYLAPKWTPQPTHKLRLVKPAVPVVAPVTHTPKRRLPMRIEPIQLPLTITETQQSGRIVKPKTQHRKDKLQQVQAVLEQKKVARAAAQLAAKTPAPSRSSTPPAKQKKPQPEVKRDVVTRAPAVKPAVRLSSVSKNASLGACIARVNSAARALAIFANTRTGDVEMKREARDARVSNLLGLYYLHRYNLSVIQLMSTHTWCKTRDYYTVMLPLRLVFAHYSSELNPAHYLQDVSDLRVVLNDFIALQTSSVSDTVSFVGRMTNLLQTSSILKQHQARLAAVSSAHRQPKSQQWLDQEAFAAYQHFVEEALPEMEYLARQLLGTGSAGFTKAEYQQALNFLVMMRFDRLPASTLARLKKMPAIAHASAYRFIVHARHTLRNQIAHSEPLSDAQVAVFCEVLLRFMDAKAMARVHEPEVMICQRVKTLFGLPVALPASAETTAFSLLPQAGGEQGVRVDTTRCPRVG